MVYKRNNNNNRPQQVCSNRVHTSFFCQLAMVAISSGVMSVSYGAFHSPILWVMVGSVGWTALLWDPVVSSRASMPREWVGSCRCRPRPPSLGRTPPVPARTP